MTQSDSLRIEPTTPKDLPLILAFVRELAEYERLLDTVTADEERIQAAMFGPHRFVESVIVYRDDEPVAFAIYYFNYSSFSALPGLYLEDIFVRPSARGSGVGRQLFRFLASKAIERGCGRMEWAVLDWNESAIRFYRNLDAEPLEGWTIFRLSRERLEDLAKEV
ncbi:MAG TPA: GNAT family N-acetyltransferase [Pyrinomonadaceae bacterium]|nr:GNAT family N-acetyltransferase [Pyrinomonadaceae bacterium]